MLQSLKTKNNEVGLAWRVDLFNTAPAFPIFILRIHIPGLSARVGNTPKSIQDRLQGAPSTRISFLHVHPSKGLKADK